MKSKPEFLPPLLLDDEQAASTFGVSTRTFAMLQAESWMPKPIVLGPRMRRWSRAELEAAVAAMPRMDGAVPEPLPLVKARAARSSQTTVR